MMKNNQKKMTVIALIISLITVLSLTECGQKDKTKKDENTIGPVIKEPGTAPAATDSQPAVTITPANIPPPVNTEPGVMPDPGKVKAPADNTKVTDPGKKPVNQKPVVTGDKPSSNTHVSPVIEKPVVKPVETPAVPEKEPEKPKPETVTKPVEVPRPAEVPKPVVNPQPDPGAWVVPAKYKTMTSPYPTGKEAFDLGKSVYGTHCKSCHGAKGDGNGPKAAQIDTKIGSFFSADFLAQKPGEVYYKTTFGRKDMPKYENKISDDEERWAVVYYIMNLKK